ncbi:MAG: SDR family oxidoreductase [Chromatiales bacterium]|jgi:NAD(P)-dependent dehydrogenase (short-subunit alcohol dehydrogenase family)|nr:SDR family oxidoreductase [Chromatiales bacterium]
MNFRACLIRALALCCVVFLAACQHAVTRPEPATAGFVAERPTVLITGSNRGIGLAFAQYYAGAGWNVIATARDPVGATELQTLASTNSQVVIEALDLIDLERIETLGAEYADVPIDVLINNAAMLGNLEKQSFGFYDKTLFDEVMAVNVFGPMMMIEAFLPSLLEGEQKKVVTMSSGLGSLTLVGGMKAMAYYRISKAGMNMSMRGIRAELRSQGITVALLAPGRVGTQLLADSGYDGPSLTPAESAAAVAKNIEALTLKDRGKPINFNGKILPW